MMAAGTESWALDKLPFGWFDVVFLALLAFGVYRGRKNGLTKEEMKEIFLQVAVYCGVPAGIDSFRNAREAFKEVEGS